jgi:predicted ATPase/class 3 adenylate cyclase
MRSKEGCMPELPTGTVTFLFTDIEGSTNLARILGDRWPDVLEEHHAILRAAIRTHGGIDIRTEGDAFFAVFTSAVDAVAACADAQRGLASHAWPEDGLVRVRMGMHTGEGRLSGEEYVGLDVHRAARIAAAGHGGQVLISDATRALAGEKLPDGVQLRDLGGHRLKDFDEPQRIHQLVIDGLPADFPSPRTLEVLTELPVQLTSLIGRERELREVADLLRGSRLVTLIGPGGTGKTRLAVEAAGRTRESFPDGVFFVDLSPVTDPSLLPNTIATTLRLREEGGRPVVEIISDHLRDRTALLLLDNFEQIIEGGRVIAELLRAAPRIRALVTSRATLGISGEQVFLVPPLGLPGPDDDVAVLRNTEAVSLFAERAKAVDPLFSLSDQSVRDVATICARLDGLPLAIELAASRIRVLPPGLMLQRLDEALPLLVGGPADAPSRQRTLSATIAWSYDLLDERVAGFFRYLSVFAGGWSLAMAGDIANPGTAWGDTVDLMEGLLQHNLIQRDVEEVEGRFRMLETIKDFGLQRLADSGEAPETRRRHAARFLELAEEAEGHVVGKDQLQWLEMLSREHDNLRAALRWAVDGGEAETGLRLGSAMWRFWQVRGHLDEGRRWIDAVLALPSTESHPAAHARCLNALGGIAYWQTDLDTALSAYAEGLRISREVGDRSVTAESLYNLGTTKGVTGDLNTAQALVEESLAIRRDLGDRRGEAWSLWALGVTHQFKGELDHALAHMEESLRIFQEVGDDLWGVVNGFTGVGVARMMMGRAQEAEEPLVRALELSVEARNEMAISNGLGVLAAQANETGRPERAVRLAGAADAVRARTPGQAPPAFDPFPDRRAKAAETLDEASIERAYMEGRDMTFDEVMAYARGDS